MYYLKTEMELSQSRERVFSFFSDVHNLELITPRWLHFKVLTPGHVVIDEGTLIDYRLWIRGAPIRWQSIITLWDPPYRFVDEQVRGPYQHWIHEHYFREKKVGTEKMDRLQSHRLLTSVVDRVEYMHFGGGLFNRWVVAPDLERIFSYRKSKLQSVLNDNVSVQRGGVYI
ncbi:MAG: SRPBCC family protein [Acidobacteriota bacterium]|nr:SRPBCC family protein [Acidobacteriota bacterium]